MPEKKPQKAYLEGLLADDDENEAAKAGTSALLESPARDRRKGGTTLLGRESALARVASGEVRQVTQLLLNPAKVRPWSGNARSYAHLNHDNCKDLIDAIIAEGGQKVPAVVRRVKDDPEFEFEVIAGTRRHWAISWLRTHSYPEMRFLAQVGDFDDEAAFRLADIENRARKDVSDLERARNYAAALADHYDGHQARMAERLKLSQGWLSKMLKVAALPDEIIAAFASPADVQLKAAYPLAMAVAKSNSSDPVFKAARVLAEDQKARQSDGRPPLPAPEVISKLLKAGNTPPAKESIVISGTQGRPAVTVLRSTKQGVAIQLHAGHGLERADLIQCVEQALKQLDESGKALAR